MPTQKKLQRGRDLFDRAKNDSDLLGLALTSIHGALEDACRNWLSTPGIKQQHGIDVQNKAEASWRNILELMPQYYGWSEQNVRYVRKMNGLRNQAAHGEEFEGTRQDLEQYLSYVENAIAFNGAFSSSETSSASTGQYFPNNIPRGAVKPFRFRIERSDRKVKIFHDKSAQIISKKSSNWQFSEFIKIACSCLLMLFLAHRFAPFIYKILALHNWSMIFIIARL